MVYGEGVMSNAIPSSQLSVVEEIRNLQKNVDDLEGVMRQHAQLLKQKAMALPTNFLADLQRTRTDLEAVGHNLDESQTELERFRALSDTTALLNTTLDPIDVLNPIITTLSRLTAPHPS